MSLLSDLESRLEKLIEGVFSRAPSRVEPMDIARFLRKEVKDGKRQGAGRVRAPNFYTIALSSSDHQHIKSLGGAVTTELENYLELEAGNQEVEYVGEARVVFADNPDLKAGEVDIVAEIKTDSEVASALAAVNRGEVVPGVAPPMAPPVAPVPDPTIVIPDPDESHHTHKSAEDSGYVLVDTGSNDVYDIPLWGAMIGRSRWADVSVPSLGISRQHAQIQFEDSRIVIEDLDSTNGTNVNDSRVTSQELSIGDEISIGELKLVLKRKQGHNR